MLSNLRSLLGYNILYFEKNRNNKQKIIPYEYRIILFMISVYPV